MKTKEDKSPLLAPSTCSADSDPRQLWLVYQWINDDETTAIPRSLRFRG